ncbi:MAG: sensor histidine kinase [Desulfarculus sp.]|nr:sensor histidine kinase [Desulfarculus sp.]
MGQPGGGLADGEAPGPVAALTPESLKAASGVCHRVKNDFQTITNILALGSAHARSPRELAEAVEGRVVALSLGYTLVSETDQPPTLDRLAQEVLRRNLWKGPAHPRLARRLPSLVLSLRLCSPLSLWLHEIIGNALRHGLEQVSDPELLLEGSLDDQGLRLSVTDNGAGLPPGFAPERDARLGLKLAMALAANDLRGGLDLEDARPGLKATLRVPSGELARLAQELWW